MFIIGRSRELYYEGRLKEQQLATGWTNVVGLATIRHTTRNPASPVEHEGPSQPQRESTRHAAARARQLFRQMESESPTRCAFMRKFLPIKRK